MVQESGVYAPRVLVDACLYSERAARLGNKTINGGSASLGRSERYGGRSSASNSVSSNNNVLGAVVEADLND